MVRAWTRVATPENHAPGRRAPMIGSAEGPVTKAERLYLIAQEIAERTPGFFAPIGSGKGNLRSNVFMAAVKITAKQVFGREYSEAKLCGENKLAIDFYFPAEETAVEIAGMLGGPNSCLRRGNIPTNMPRNIAKTVCTTASNSSTSANSRR